MNAKELKQIADNANEEKQSGFARSLYLEMIQNMEKRATEGYYNYEYSFSAFKDGQYVEVLMRMFEREDYKVHVWYDNYTGENKIEVSWDD